MDPQVESPGETSIETPTESPIATESDSQDSQALALAKPRAFAAPAILDHKLIRRLGIEAAPADTQDAFLLTEGDGAFDLRPPGEHARPGIRAAFPPDKRAPGKHVHGAGRNPLVRAFGKQIEEIFDLTAGLGGDAYRLAQSGFRVHAFERDPTVYAVLASGWENAREEERVSAEVVARLSFEYAEGFEQIDRIEGANIGVYVDPMYPPPKRKSAKPRRELQVLRAMLGGQVDAARLVESARERAARVVVKRPHHADPLVPGASFEVETKLVRFDVYVNPSRMKAPSS